MASQEMLIEQVLADPGTDRNGVNIEIASDRLSGVPAIANFWGCNTRQCRYLIARGLLPVARQGSLYIASKRVLTEHYRKLTDPSATSPQA